MYAKPDTTTLQVGGAEILVAVHSPKGRIVSGEIAQGIEKLLEAQKEYLGGSLPIQKYAFLFSFFAGQTVSGAYGALEHSYSSFYYLPEASAAYLMPSIIEISAHEFFHILTPLNIHSEEIHYFDFANPKMSRHLWLYEGVTEYFAQHVLLCNGMASLEDFLTSMRENILEASRYKNTPFTTMSLGALDKHEDEYNNVYAKGALIGLCLDLELRRRSKGKYGLMHLMQDLSEKYGKDKPFKDEELFDVITEMTFPEIREFFARYVEDNQPLPLTDLLSQVGVEYQETGLQKSVSLGEISLAANTETQRVFISEANTKDPYTKKAGWRTGDSIESLNGKPINAGNIVDAINSIEEGQSMTWEVLREQKGKPKIATIKITPKVSNRKVKFLFQANPAATPEQIQLRQAWMSNAVRK
jgi:predicted metalloprotease with PDZ domain